MNQDEEHLRLLSIFYYVAAGFAAMGACFGALYLVIGIVLLMKPEAMGPPSENPAGFSGVPLTIIGGGLALIAFASVACFIFAGLSFRRKKNYGFCLVMAGICCVFFPLGTVLGVFSIIVLMRPTVKALFDGAIPPIFAK